jgi:hypothetical protein
MSTRWLFSLGERHNSGLKKISDVHLTFFFWPGYFTECEKICQKMGKIHQLFETTKQTKKTLVGGGLP